MAILVLYVMHVSPISLFVKGIPFLLLKIRIKSKTLIRYYVLGQTRSFRLMRPHQNLISELIK